MKKTKSSPLKESATSYDVDYADIVECLIKKYLMLIELGIIREIEELYYRHYRTSNSQINHLFETFLKDVENVIKRNLPEN